MAIAIKIFRIMINILIDCKLVNIWGCPISLFQLIRRQMSNDWFQLIINQENRKQRAYCLNCTGIHNGIQPDFFEDKLRNPLWLGIGKWGITGSFKGFSKMKLIQWLFSLKLLSYWRGSVENTRSDFLLFCFYVVVLC